MKSTIIFFLSVIAISSAFSSVVSPGQPALLSRFAAGLAEAKTQGQPLDLEKWSDIEALPIELQVRMLGTHVQDRPNISDYFVIIPRSERAKFLKGDLLLISATPFNLTAWYREWYEKHENYTPEQLADYDKFNPKDEIIRWYLAKDKEGKYERTSITEDELALIIQQTGLKIPRPIAYRFNMSQVDPATGRPINAPASLSTPVVASGAETVVAPTPKPEPARVPPPPAKSSNLLWWIVGAIAALAAVVFVARRKKPKV